MFQLSRSSEPNPTNVNPNTALPNSYGNIRTLKGDLENTKMGKSNASEKDTGSSHDEIFSENQPPAAPPATPQGPPPSQHVTAPPKNAPSHDAGKVSPKKGVPNPFGSETFFNTQSPFEEKADISKREQPEIISKPKSSSKLVIFVSIFLIILILGGAGYYWWFFMRSPASDNSSTTQTTQTPADTSEQAISAEEGNTDLKKWSFDLNADKIANKLAVERNISALSNSVSEGKATEIKIVSNDGQLVTPQEFEEFFDFQLPASIADKLTNEYSLFLTKETNKSRLGAAFKLSQSENLAESLKSEESNIISNLKSFYLNEMIGEPEAVFSSSKYKSADIRYFNFPNLSNVSLDYTILSDKQNAYFIFSTSKNSIRAILDYMSEK